MSVLVKCVITIEEKEYEGLSKNMQIFEVLGWVSSTGTFASFPSVFLDKFVESAVDKAKQNAHDKIEVIKGKTPPELSKKGEK